MLQYKKPIKCFTYVLTRPFNMVRSQWTMLPFDKIMAEVKDTIFLIQELPSRKAYA